MSNSTGYTLVGWILLAFDKPGWAACVFAFALVWLVYDIVNRAKT